MLFFNLKTQAQVSSNQEKITEVSVVISPKVTHNSLDKFKNILGNQRVDVVPDAQDINASEIQNTSGHRYISVQEDKPIIVLNGKTLAKSFNLNSIDPNDIATIDVLKDDTAEALYGVEAGQRGVIMIVTKAYTKDSDSQKTDSLQRVTVIKNGKNDQTIDFKGTSKGEVLKDHALYVVNGKVMKTGFDIDSIEADDIESVNVLKGVKAITKYGEKGEGGVIEIKMKE